MVEAGAKEVPEAQMVQALERAHAAIKEIVAGIDALAAQAGKTKRARRAEEGIVEGPRRGSRGQGPRPARRRDADQGQARELRDRRQGRQATTSPAISDEDLERKAETKPIAKSLKEKILRDEILERGQRLDGRKFDEIRNITIEVGVLPRTHGSCLFTRGETQALVTATLGTADDQQKVETVDGETWKRFMLHYNFPPFSVGEVKFLRGPGRREIGHGALAERSLVPMMPAEENFPYTVRVVSEILESNGSSSMASVCGGSLAMMDAGVPLKAPVAGVAMGLVMNEETGKYAILSDIAGAEDHYGDMDFKVTGTAPGITALQMDIKVAGITTEIMTKALEQARQGRMHILGKMQETLAAVAHGRLGARAAHRHDPDSGRQDPRRHRTGRQDDPQHHRADRREDRRRGRRPVNVASADEASAQKAIAHHPGADRDARAQQDLHGQGPADHRLRRLRRDHAGPRRPAARVRDRALPRQGRARRAEGRGTGDGQGDQHRPLRQDSTQPQGAAPARRGAREA